MNYNPINDTNIFNCDGCDELFHIDEMTERDGKMYCEDCGKQVVSERARLEDAINTIGTEHWYSIKIIADYIEALESENAELRKELALVREQGEVCERLRRIIEKP